MDVGQSIEDDRRAQEAEGAVKIRKIEADFEHFEVCNLVRFVLLSDFSGEWLGVMVLSTKPCNQAFPYTISACVCGRSASPPLSSFETCVDKNTREPPEPTWPRIARRSSTRSA